MAIRLERLLADIRGDEEDLVVLALRTLARLSDATFTNNEELARAVRVRVEELSSHESDEVRYFASEVARKLDSLFPDSLAGGKAGTACGEETVSLDEGTDAPAEGEAHGASGDLRGGAGSSQSSGRVVGTFPRESLVAVLQAAAKGGIQDPKIVLGALIRLRENGRSEDAVLMLPFLRSPSPLFRREAARTVACIAPPAVIADLMLQLMNDQVEEVVGAAVSALDGIAPATLAGLMSRALETDKISLKIGVVKYLCRKLSGAGDESVTNAAHFAPLLMKAACDREEEVRFKVAEGLSLLPAAREYLEVAARLVNDMDIDVAERALPEYQRFERDVRRVSGGGRSDSGGGGPGVEGSSLGAEVIESVQAADSGAGHGPGSGPEDGERPDGDGADDSSEEVLVSVEELPESLQRECDEIYEMIDGELEKMGRKIWRMVRSDLLRHPAFSKLVYDIERYVDMLNKRKEALNDRGVFDRIFSSGVEAGRKVRELEEALGEKYRFLGEVAFDLFQKAEYEVAELAESYGAVERLLGEVRRIKLSFKGDD